MHSWHNLCSCLSKCLHSKIWIKIYLTTYKWFEHKWFEQETSFKLEFKHSQSKVEFLDVLVYKDQNDMLQAAIYRKQKDRQNYLDVWSEHPKLLKDSIFYRQALRTKQISSSQQEFLSHTTKMPNQFQKRGYNKPLIEQKIYNANLQERKQLLKEKKTLPQLSLYRSNTTVHFIK